MKRGLVQSISYEEIRQILRSVNITPQRTKTWKESDGQDFEIKKEIKKLYKGRNKRWQSNLCICGHMKQRRR